VLRSFEARNETFLLARAFDFAQKLAQVRDVDELVKLQMDFIGAQIQAMTDQAKDLSETVTRVVMDSLKTSTPNENHTTVTVKALAAALAERHGMPKKRVEELLSGAVALITRHLKKGDRVRIAGLGTLQVRSRAARIGRNPATGEQIEIKVMPKTRSSLRKSTRANRVT
jgi:DNA-binding protein HU-beta